MTIITLLTDFGTPDGYPGVMKGVIWKIAPEVQITDICHTIRPQNILHGALVLRRTTHYFPPGTIHVAVVDPGVGTERRPICIRCGTHYFIGPDNGLFTLVLEQAEENQERVQTIHLDQRQYWLPEISHVFHGRDIFAPSAAHLANGVPFEKLGTFIHDPFRLQIPHPEPIPQGGLRGQVIDIDSFGNLSTNIDQFHLMQMGIVSIQVAGRRIEGLVRTYGDQPEGALIALLDSSGLLAISVVNGSAAQLLQAEVGDQIEVIPK